MQRQYGHILYNVYALCDYCVIVKKWIFLIYIFKIIIFNFMSLFRCIITIHNDNNIHKTPYKPSKTQILIDICQSSILCQSSKYQHKLKYIHIQSPNQQQHHHDWELYHHKYCHFHRNWGHNGRVSSSKEWGRKAHPQRIISWVCG